jgi:5-methylcytosine-specific restriction protein A
MSARRLRSPCRQPGCPALQPCSAHPIKPWSRSRPRRMPGGNGWAWQRLRVRILLRDGYTCRYCGQPATVVDHVVGLARGGSDDPANLVASCKLCNELKRRREAREGRS